MADRPLMILESQTLRSNWKVILFGMVALYFSSIGQASLFAQYIPSLKASLAMSMEEISAIYMIASIMSAFILPSIGKIIDEYSTTSIIVFSTIILAIGIYELGVAQNAFMLFIGIFFIRGPGQVSMSLATTTYINKNYHAIQGKIIGLALLGRSLGWATLPTFAIFLIEHFGRKTSSLSLGFFSLVALFIMLPLIHNSNHNNNSHVPSSKSHLGNKKIQPFHYFIMFSFSLNPLILTGLFFHQQFLQDWKQLSLLELSYSFPIFAFMQFVTSFFIGPVVDKVSATKLLPYSLIPIIVSLISLFILDGTLSFYLYSIFAGLSVGMNSNIRDNFWSEQIDFHILGQTKGVDSFFSVFAAAISPLLFSYLLGNSNNSPDLIMICVIMITMLACTCTFLFKQKLL